MRLGNCLARGFSGHFCRVGGGTTSTLTGVWLASTSGAGWGASAAGERDHLIAILASELAMLAKGVQKSGTGMSARNNAATQNALMWVNSASSDSTATNWNWS